MHMGAAQRAFEQAGYQNFFYAEGGSANGAVSRQIPIQAVYAALDVHKAVASPGDGREGHSLYQIASFQFGGAKGTGLGVAGRSHFPVIYLLVPAFPFGVEFQPYSGVQGVAEPQQKNGDSDKSQ